jgi:hypothetical protein
LFTCFANCHFVCQLPVFCLFQVLPPQSCCLSLQWPQLINLFYIVKLNVCYFGVVSFLIYYRHFSIKGIFRPSHVCFILRYSSSWNPHRLHSEHFPPKEKHNVRPLRFDDDHHHSCTSFAQVRIFGGKKECIRSLQHV